MKKKKKITNDAHSNILDKSLKYSWETSLKNPGGTLGGTREGIIEEILRGIQRKYNVTNAEEIPGGVLKAIPEEIRGGIFKGIP